MVGDVSLGSSPESDQSAAEGKGADSLRQWGGIATPPFSNPYVRDNGEFFVSYY